MTKLIIYLLFLLCVCAVTWVCHKAVSENKYDLELRFLHCRYLAAYLAAIFFFCNRYTFSYLLLLVDKIINWNELSNLWNTVLPMRRYELVYLVVPLVVLAFIFANHFNIVGMGRDFSSNLGVNYNLVLLMGLTIAAMITASVVVVVGSISYIGLIVPNLVAMFKGDKIRGTLVATALLGALFVLACDVIGRIVIAPYELPIELIIGILGSLLFIALLLYRLRHGRKAVRLGALFSRKEEAAP